MFKTLKYFILIFTFMISTTVFAKNVTLQWDPNTEPDLGGYKVYYDSDTGTPWVGDEAVEGKSPIRVWVNGKKPSDPEYADDLELADNANPEFTLTGLVNEDVHYFTVTAFDTELPVSLESDHSNEVTAAAEEAEDFFELPSDPTFMTSEAATYLFNLLKDWRMV
jgi:hypothetical protein